MSVVQQRKHPASLDGEPVLTIREIADRTGRTPQGILQSIAKGDLRAQRDPTNERYWLVKTSDLADWLARPGQVRGLKERWALYREWRTAVRGDVA